jgi:hypothetical protein
MQQHLAEIILVVVVGKHLRHEMVGGVGMGGVLDNCVGYLVDEWLV